MRKLAAGLAMALMACHPTVTSGGIEVYESIWTRTDHELRYRSAMDLRCKPEAMTLTLVRREGRYPTAVHAAGCGAQAMYGRRLRRHHGKFTDANTTWEVESAAAAGAVAADL